MFWSLVLIQSITLGIFVSFMCKTMSTGSISPLPHTIMDDIRERELKYFKTKEGIPAEPAAVSPSHRPAGKTAWVSRYLYPELWDDLPEVKRLPIVKMPPQGDAQSARLQVEVQGPSKPTGQAGDPGRPGGMEGSTSQEGSARSSQVQGLRAEQPAALTALSMSASPQLECSPLKEGSPTAMSLDLTGDLPEQMLQYLFARTWAAVRGVGVIKKSSTAHDHLRLSYPGVGWSQSSGVHPPMKVDSSVCGGVYKRNYLYHYKSRNLAKCLFSVPANFAIPNEVVVYFEGRNSVSFDAMRVQASRDFDVELIKRVSPDVIYFKSAIEHVMRTLNTGAMISIVCEPKFLMHPTVLQLKQLYNSRVVHVNPLNDMNRAVHAAAFIGSFGDLSWMSAFLTGAKQIHLPYWSDLDENAGGKISETLGTWPKLFIHDDERLCYWDLNQPTSCSPARQVLAARTPFATAVLNRSDDCIFRQQQDVIAASGTQKDSAEKTSSGVAISGGGLSTVSGAGNTVTASSGSRLNPIGSIQDAAEAAIAAAAGRGGGAGAGAGGGQNFVMNHGQGLGQESNRDAAKGLQQGPVHGVQDLGQESCVTQKGNVLLLQNVMLDSKPLQENVIFTSSPHKCCEICGKTNGCASFTWTTDTYECWLRGEAKSSRLWKGIVAGEMPRSF
ncbi:hypothetical protein GUITHDRAFT_113686 [Guillardia theta CCMP2712]|uniref:Apple domain-containing protein n=1 Tax=Guillardia theta (strain CCMP2712) TaxID=905079 RepID=L1IWJ0_GUITC|nr:hypothetical protein GUITHDRAFT_113686 [Guillardia theta CCMP2712]EKX40205.1 hypothetical protein GUITHDRAFT_113686 [Guillardia theta CCMP2712]|eukprot:XP_005827185.1 hypothetical protein GUITHDRAFT_113686 [Guillardia theta CCMP2712]